jgi:hypothetical protein
MVVWLPRIRLKVRSLSIAIAIVAAALACLRPRSSADVSVEQAVEIAAALVMQDDPSFSPEKHKAKVYRGCSRGPLVVDLYSEMDTYVVKQVLFTIKGDIIGPRTFGTHERVKSYLNGRGMYVLDRSGKVVGLAPYVIGPDGEIAGLAAIVPFSNPSPELPSRASGRP